MREVVELVLAGERMVGTLHRPPEADPALPGVLFLNAGHVPRDGHGGLWALAADRLAGRGHVVARFDFPGLGDSPGELPAHIKTFWRRVKAGEMAPLAVALAEWLRAQHAPAGVVLGGLCGAAITAIYASEARPELVRGLVLMEPEFFLTDPSEGEQEALAPGRLRWLSRIFSTFAWLRLFSGASQLAHGRFPRLRRLLAALLLRFLSLPERTNLELVRAWRRVLDRRIPALVFTVENDFWDLYYRKATQFVLAGRPPPENLRHYVAVDTSHAYTRNEGITTALAELDRWFRRGVPPCREGQEGPGGCPAGPAEVS